MAKPNQSELARQFLALHDGHRTLLLPNGWDVASARIFEDAGFPAVATSSAGAADVEAGYGTRPEDAAETARQVIAAGAVGMNLEDAIPDKPDALADLNLQVEKIRAVNEISERAGIAFVLNARTDVFLAEIGPAETRVARAIVRLNAYRDAGAQSLFVPGIKDKETIAQLVNGVRGPVNILATGGTPSLAELEKLGVARVSVGSGPMRATLGLLSRIARQLHDEDNFSLMTDGAMTYADANRLFTR